MANVTLMIIDDFYDDPDKIRKNALQLKFFRKKGATYPGLEAIDTMQDWSSVRNRLRDYIPDKVDGKGTKNPPFSQGKFRIATARDETTRIDRVHIDQQKWSGVVYLSKDKDCKSGLIFYKHKPTNKIYWDNEWFFKNKKYLFHLDAESQKKAMLEMFRNKNEFEEIGTVPIRYNRAIVFMAYAYHGTGDSFGTSKLNGRLTQHFEFYEDDL